VRLRKVVGVLEALVLQPNDVEVELVPTRQLLVAEPPPAPSPGLLAPRLGDPDDPPG
jgi:hypothetical protein